MQREKVEGKFKIMFLSDELRQSIQNAIKPKSNLSNDIDALLKQYSQMKGINVYRPFLKYTYEQTGQCLVQIKIYLNNGIYFLAKIHYFLSQNSWKMVPIAHISLL